MELICTNGEFSKEHLKFYSEHGIITPEQDKIYTVRDVIQNYLNGKGFLLEELVNPKIPINHPVIGPAHTEPNWSISRFSLLNGEEVREEQIREFLKQNKYATKD